MEYAPHDRVLHLYELGIEGCSRRNTTMVSSALVELMTTLNFEESVIAEGFERLYDYCLRKIRERQFERVSWILSDLHDTWAEAAEESRALRAS